MQNQRFTKVNWSRMKGVVQQTFLVAAFSTLAMTHSGIANATPGDPSGKKRIVSTAKRAFNRIQETITGKVTDANGSPLPGVSILEKGSTNGTLTDAEGKYTLNVKDNNAILVFSFIGFLSEEVAVGSRQMVDIKLLEDIKSLSEVVVVGYGVQKKSVVTGAISSVKASELESMPITRVEQAMQGRVSGITIAANSGQPGSAATVRIRGNTSIGSSDPLWVIDGVVVDNGGIGYLNQSDIESLEVLKDAASQAIYGARAAAGVVLVTTKKGKAGTIHVNYNGFYGSSAPARKLDLLNATQYATLRNEAASAAGKALPYADPASFGAGTDWQDQIFNKSARRQNHEVSISGGSEKSTFYASFGYLDQEGIVATDISTYKRYNIRLNSTHKIAKWLSFGQNLGYSHEKTVGIGNTNNEFGGPLSSAINLDPITPTVITDPTVAAGAPYSTNAGIRRDANGNPYGISQAIGNEITNPLAYITTRLGNYNWADNIVGNVYAEAEPLKGLKFRSSLGSKLAFYGEEAFSPISYLNALSINPRTSLRRVINQRFDWNLENTVSYNRTLGDHNVTVLLGQGSYLDNRTRMNSVTFQDVPYDNFDDASFNNKVLTTSRVSDASEGQLHTVSSLFARLNYNYKEKYIVEGIIRRDGSSRFGPNKRYGIFPSFSLGWVASKEDFWPTNNIVNFLKVRGGRGTVGNDNIGDFAFLSTIGSGRNYTFGNSGSYAVGNSPNAPSNPDLKWEETTQTNIGLDATLVQDVTLTVEWFNKTTKDLLLNPRIPSYVGAVGNPAANIGTMVNKGVEIELGYQKALGDLNLSFRGNTSFIKNEVTYLGNGINFITLNQQTFQASAYPITRTAVGQPLNSFYGFKTMGIFQNQEEVNNYRNEEGKVIQPSARPGDFKWFDKNGDGTITEADRDFIGNPFPSLTYGLTFTASYKGFDLLVFGQGVHGNKIFQGLRRLDLSSANWPTSALSRWTGEGSSNSYPRLVEGDPNKNFTTPSDFYLQDGDYFRIKTLQIGYTIPSALSKKLALQKARIYLMSENLLTFTKYTGYDPEIGGGVLSIDRGIYPQARSFMVGLNLGF